MSNTNEIFAAALGRLPGVSRVLQFGYNPAVGNGAVETIWEPGGIKVYDSSATTMYVSSSSTADNGTTSPLGAGATSVIVEGLDENWDTQTEIVTLAGQTGVVIPTDFIRVRVISVIGGAPNVGDLHVGTEENPAVGVPAAANVRLKAVISHGESMSGAYTVPANKTALMLSFNAFGGKGDDITGDFYLRPFGLVFTIKGKVNIFETPVPVNFAATVPIPAKTDLEIRAIASTQNTVVSAYMEFLLFDNVGA